MAGTLDFYNYDIEANGVISQKQQQAKIDSAQNEKIKELEQVGGYPPEGGIPATDLASGVQSSLGKADTAYQKPSNGIPKTDLDSSVQESLNNAEQRTQCYVEGSPETPVGIFDSTQSNLNVIDSSSSGCALYLWLNEQDMNSGEVKIILPSVRQLKSDKVYNSIYIVSVQQGSSLFCSLPISDESIGLTKVYNSTYNTISSNPGLYEVNCMFASSFWFINACLITTP